jgi:homoserine O-succinyltransferase
MPLVALSDLPTFQRLQDEHHDVLSIEKAKHQDIRELHIGLLNMMPDASLKATERQFMRLVGDCNQIVQFHVHLFTIPKIERSDKTNDWITRYYEDFETIKKHGLDALIISGANPKEKKMQQEKFWPMLTTIIDWARVHVTSILCACLATHAVMEYLYGIQRIPLKKKQWGIFEHRLTQKNHPLVRHMNTRFNVPHSRNNQVTLSQIKKKGLLPLAMSDSNDLHIIVSPDGFRFIFFQGHPEYDDLSLFKEYQREVHRWFEQDDPFLSYPPYPKNYFSHPIQCLLSAFKEEVIRAKANHLPFPPWKTDSITLLLDNTWRDTALSIYNNWLGLVYRLTHKHVDTPFMENINPNEPLKNL